ncbi:MAG TPA: hypothetical protein VGW10_04300 [Solirubrobacteraceae bacterium]|nr:hypothetical protein [Solirubrobacteraceae bacterium]
MLGPLIASGLDAPLQVAAVILSIAALCAGATGAVALIRGSSRDEISEATTRGAALGFIVGIVFGVVAVVYLVLS